jgi:hypothetical protein
MLFLTKWPCYKFSSHQNWNVIQVCHYESIWKDVDCLLTFVWFIKHVTHYLPYQYCWRAVRQWMLAFCMICLFVLYIVSVLWMYKSFTTKQVRDVNLGLASRVLLRRLKRLQRCCTGLFSLHILNLTKVYAISVSYLWFGNWNYTFNRYLLYIHVSKRY